ncbi:MAG: phage portal protein [Aureibaculum sp.]|nr:phage portal protein [Aureibaculum sp.]
MFGNKKLSEKVSVLEDINKDLQQKTGELSTENHKMNSILGSFMGYNYEGFSGETTFNELGAPKEIIIMYESLRVRSWEFLLKNHIASLIVSKRVNWLIGSGLLFNAKPYEQPFKEYYGEVEGKKKQQEFIRKIEYQYRNFANTIKSDYEKSKTLHEMSRHADYNACGDGDILMIQRVENGFPTLQAISGQCVVDPSLTDENIPKGNSVCEGVEKNKNGEVVAYHVLIETNISNGVFIPNPDTQLDYGTKRIEVYFKNNKNIKQAWLYRSSDLQKLGETRAMPLISHLFETLKHVNDYLIANSKNAQLLSQLVYFLEKDQNSTGEKLFGSNSINVGGMGDSAPVDKVASDSDVALSANKIERRLDGNGIALDLPKGVTAKLLNPTAQSDQAEYLNSTLRTIFAEAGTPYEVMLSSYDSNYSASMGARSDYQYNLDVLTEIIPSNQLYKINYKLFLYLQVLKGEIDCPPLLKAYDNNDAITIEAITNSKFEGTKLKPIDPVKFINSLRAQLPEKIRELVPLNTTENLVNAASGGDYESVLNQIINEMALIPKDLEPEKEVSSTY